MSGWLTVLVVVAGLALLGLALSVRIVQQYEKGVLFRLGRVIGVREPGLRLIVPVIEELRRVSLRIVTMPRRGAVDSRHVRVGWFRTMDARMIGVARAFQDRLALLVVPPQATTAAAEIAMAMAADPTNTTGPADILAAAGIAFPGDARTLRRPDRSS